MTNTLERCVLIVEGLKFTKKGLIHLILSSRTESLSRARADLLDEIEKSSQALELLTQRLILDLYSTKTTESTKDLIPDTQTGQNETSSSMQ